MLTSEQARNWWSHLRTLALSEPARRIVVRRSEVPHPRDAGAYASAGLPIGQDEDFRFPAEHDCRGVHVQGFGAVWALHVDGVHPTCGVIEHLRADAPGTFIAALSAAGGLLGLALGRSKGAAVAGAIIGAAVGAMAAAERRGAAG